MRLFTSDEATELLDMVFNVAPDSDGPTQVEAFIAGIRDDQAQQDVNSYLALLTSQIDPDSIEIKADKLDGADMDCAFIKIKVSDTP